jgi:subtilisin family serine protease
MEPLYLVNLPALMGLTNGRAEIAVGLIDGPVAIKHPDLAGANIHTIRGTQPGACIESTSLSCMHGTLVAGILAARRGCSAPAICPDCTLLVRAVFAETQARPGQVTSAVPEELAAAIVECIEAKARIINLSVAVSQPSISGNREIEEALNLAARRGVIVVAAAGNQGTLAGSAITRHPWVIPVVACDLRATPLGYSNLGNSIGKRGLMAPGVGVTSLSPDGKSLLFEGTSAAAPFVTGAIALLWSEFPNAGAGQVKFAVVGAKAARRITVVPPLLDAWAAYKALRG